MPEALKLSQNGVRMWHMSSYQGFVNSIRDTTLFIAMLDVPALILYVK